jgi:hypothetical protein
MNDIGIELDTEMSTTERRNAWAILGVMADYQDHDGWVNACHFRDFLNLRGATAYDLLQKLASLGEIEIIGECLFEMRVRRLPQ